MKVKDYEVSRISEGLYNVHLELKEEQPASYVPKGWSIRSRAGANMYA